MTRAVIADDEALMREQLRARLDELWPELEIVAEAKNGVEAVEQVAALRPEVVFLDIRMPAKTGIEAAREIAALDGCLPEIVFVTAYDQYAIDAPAGRDRLRAEAGRARAPRRHGRALAQAPCRAVAVIGHAAAGARQPGGETGTGVAAEVDPGLRRQPDPDDPVDDVLFFVSDEKYTRVQTAQQEALIRKPIKELLAELDPAQFWQIHRSTLINARAIAGIVRDERGRQLVAVKGRPEKLEVSRSYAYLFKGM